MLDRQRFTWNVITMTEDGQTHEAEWSSYWSPNRDFVTNEGVASAAAAERTIASQKKHQPISAERVG